MSERSLSLARALLEKLGGGAPIEEFSGLVSDDLVFEIAGDPTAFPWIGPQRTGRQAFLDFVRDQRELLATDTFRVDDILHNDARAVVIGEFSATARRTGKGIRSRFVLILTVSGEKIVGFNMLEDSFAVSRAAH